MHYAYDDIVRRFDPATFARGERYFRENMVIGIDVADKAIYGQVAGSGANVYGQSVFIEAGRHGIHFDSECSCPMQAGCKHVVALLLAGLRSAPTDAIDVTVGLPPAAELWLQQFASMQSLMQLRAPAPVKELLIFVLVPGRGGDPSLSLCKARLRKDGSIGGAIVQNDTYRLLSAAPAEARDEDEELIRLFAALKTGTYQQTIYPAGRFGARLLDRVCAEGRLWWSTSLTELRRGGLSRILPGPARRAGLGWAADGAEDGSLGLRWRFEDGAPVGQVLPTVPPRYLEQGLLGELALPGEYAAMPQDLLLKLVSQAPRLAPEQGAAMAERSLELALDRVLPLPPGLQTLRRKDIRPRPVLVLDSLSAPARGRQAWHDHAVLLFDYDGMLVPDETSDIRRVGDGAIELIERDAHAQAAAQAVLAGHGFVAPAASTILAQYRGALVLPTEAAWVAFARNALAHLQAAGWEIEFGADYRYQLLEAQEWYAELNEEGEGAGAWFALELGVLVEGRRHSLLPLLLQMIREAPQEFDAAALASRDDDSALVVALPDLTRVALSWGRIKPILATLGELYFSDRIGQALRLPVMDAARLAELEAAAQLRWLGGERLRALGRKLQDFKGIRQVDPPDGLRATLRPYQQAGLSWLQFLREYGFGGILADDMGLGKTIQTLAHVLAEKEAGRLDAPALVVAPTSLMGNWQAEAARFAPGLRVLLLHGKERSAQFERIGDADLVLTTYPLLARDEEGLRRHRYHLLILDEAQYIKNSRSKAAQTARLINARHRLCLTGTPVQNHLGELWSQFHFLMPGLLGEEKAFNAGFRKPIEQQGDGVRRDLLARRVKPFMLRRTKDKVATELPPKTEVVLPVDFGAAQRDLYETVRLAMDRKVRDEIDRKGFARSQIVILDALLTLRQVCCDPRLLKTGGKGAESAKLGVLLELLETLLSEQRKILIFSQFTSMLSLIADALRERGVDFVTLTGDTVDRSTPVAAFQQGSAAVFLISLKAGGVGLNLTAADTVVHYDPWWNPASENQATDRAWRIGQEQPVFVYKLIARGTLEEKIQDMQRRKGELAQGLLEAEGGLSPAIGASELQAIFAPLAP